MGTSAVFAVVSENASPGADDCYYNTIIGMTMDGFKENLDWIALECIKTAKKLRCLTAFKKRQFSAVKKVFEQLEKENDGWLFVDRERNAAWISNSAIFDPKNMTIHHYDEKFEYRVCSKRVSPPSPRKENMSEQKGGGQSPAKHSRIVRQTLIRYIDAVHGNAPQHEVNADESVIFLRKLLNEAEAEKHA